MTTERIAAAIKPILDEDRRADRERIAALERTIGFLNLRVSNEEERANGWQAMVADLNKQIDALTEKCAALVVERNSLAAENAGLHRQCDDLRISMGRATPLRIDTDMSDPQPGKLLVVRLMTSDAGLMRDGYSVEAEASQWVGFLVETPAVEVKRTPKVGDRVRVRDEVGVVVQVGITTAAVRFRDNDECPFLIAEIEVIE